MGRDVEWGDLCTDDGSLTRKGALDQAAVEDWYSKWVVELVRIAKPGKAIIIEQVSWPTCKDDGDWGGVTQYWWKRAIHKYNWDVDPHSLIFRDFNPHSKTKKKRYNVYMEKLA